jgi:pimeloyl-ACP methyl ester carboxylesterase
MNSTPVPIVLVHGAWHGGWCWSRVAAILRDAGHAVLTPTLTGLGERAHLLSRSVGLDTHVADIAGVFESEEIQGAMLVGHSYGGMVITGVADRLAGTTAISRLAYLDAFVPRDGESWADFHSPEVREATAANARDNGEGWWIPPRKAEGFGVTDPDDAAWVNRRMTRQPLATYTQPLRLARGGAANFPCAYIDCANPASPSFVDTKKRIQSDRDWMYFALQTGHDAMVTVPRELAEILLELSRDNQ